MEKKELQQGNKSIGPLTGCMLEEALALVWDVFSECEAEKLSQEALDEFWARIDYEYMLQRAGDGEIRFWGAFDDDFLVGVCAMRDLSHIELLYVDPAYHRQGIGTNLLKHAFIDCKELDESLRRVTVNATEFSRNFFLKQGFTATAAQRRVDGLLQIPMALEGQVI